MARKNSNARRRDKSRRTRIKIKKPKAVMLPVCKELNDGISPGKLKAVAEWRD